MKTLILNAWRKYGGRLMVLLFGPLILLATPVITTKAQQWFGYHLTAEQVRDYTLTTLGLLGTKMLVWLLNNGKVDKALAEAEVVASKVKAAPTGNAVPDIPADDEPALPPGM